MITIEEIKNITFRKAGFKGGYDEDDVNTFIDDVVEAFEQLRKEKTNLVHKIDVLATRVEQYRADEETVRNALLASQKVSDACIREAKEKAAKIVREAETKAQALLVDANRMTAIEKENYLQLQADAVNLRAELIELYKEHIQNIDSLPTSVDLEESRKEIDEKYPTEEVVPEHKEPVMTEEPQEPVSEVTEQPQAQSNVSGPKSQIKAKQSKFAHLKFGDNYDVSAE